MSARTHIISKAKIVAVAFLSLSGMANAQPATMEENSPAWRAIVEAAKSEGTVRIAGHPSELRRAAFAAFHDAYPEIRIEYVSIGSHGQADGRLKAEWAAEVFNWDILSSGGQFVYGELAPKNALTPIHEIITRSDVVDDRLWRNGFDSGFVDKEGKFVFSFMTYIAETAFVNTDSYPLSDFKNVGDLLDPKYKGKIAWADPRGGGVPEIMTAFIYQRLGEVGLRELLTKQEPQIVGTSRQLLDAMVRGSRPIGIGLTTGALRQMTAAGLGSSIKRIDFVDSRNEGRTGGFIAVPKKAPHPNAARVFATWLVSKKGQEAWVNLAKENSARLDVPIADEDRYPDPKFQWFAWDREETEFLTRYQLPARKIANEILGNRK